MRSDHRGIALSLGSAFLGAVSLIAYKAAGTVPEPALLVLATLLWAALLNTLVIGTKAAAMIARARAVEVVTAAALAALTVTANLALLAALERINPAIVAVITSTQVLIVALFAWPILGERPSWRFALGALIALLGFALMRAPGDSDSTASLTGPGANTAVLWALVAAASWASMQVITRRVIRRIRPAPVNLLRLWIAGLGLGLVLTVQHAGLPALASLELKIWLLAGLAALCGPFLARLSLIYALRYLPASHSTLLTLAGPVFAAVLALIVFGLVPSGRELLGALVLLMGIALPVGEMARADKGEMARADK